MSEVRVPLLELSHATLHIERAERLLAEAQSMDQRLNGRALPQARVYLALARLNTVAARAALVPGHDKGATR